MSDECIRYVVEYIDPSIDETKEESFGEDKLDDAHAFAQGVESSGTIYCVTYREVDREMIAQFAPS